MFQNLVPKIMGWVQVVITLALAPTITTYNTAVTTNVTDATNKAYMIGMTAIDDFGAFIIIMGLLVTGGLFGVSAMRGGNKGASVRDMLGIIGAVIVTIVALAIFSGSVIGYIDDLITASSGFAKTAFGILTVIIYVGIIGSASVFSYMSYRKSKKGSKKSSARVFV